MIQNNRIQKHAGRRKIASNASYASQRRNPVLTLAESRRKANTQNSNKPQAQQTVQKNTYKRTPMKTVKNKPGIRIQRVSQVQPIKKINTTTTALNRKKRYQKSTYIKSNKYNKPRNIIKKINGDEVLRIIPLGGCEEVGRNMTVFEYYKKGQEKNKDIIILDMGLQFPEEDMPGIDYIIPNIEYLKGQEKNIRAVVFSHGHLDHIGAAPMLLEKLGNPMIIGRDLTLEMIKHRVEDYKKGTSRNLKTSYIKTLNDKYSFGKMTVKFFAVEHSIKDAVGFILETPAGTVIHPGDWDIRNGSTR